MRHKGLFALALAIIGLIALANAARHSLIQGPLLTPGEIVFDQTYALAGTLDDDLLVVAEQVDLGSDSRVTGDVALISAAITLHGQIDGDLTVLGEFIEIAPDARINGNATLLAETAIIRGTVAGQVHTRADRLTIDAQASLEGEVFACYDVVQDARTTARPILPCENNDLLSSTGTMEALRDPRFVLPVLNVTVGGAALVLLFSALGSMALSGLSILAVVMFPRQISYIEAAIRSNPRALGGTGLLMLLLGAGLSFALGLVLVVAPPIGLILTPVYLVVALLFAGMVLAGWITVTLVIGDLILRRLGATTLPPLVIAAVGNVSLLLVWNVLALNDYSRILGALALVLLGAVGLGAVFTTRLGTRPIHRSYLVQG
jgi:hypothetical protein